jgi:hypothetical protein
VSAAPYRLREALEPWCAAGVSGALCLLDAPGGAVYIVDGRIAYAECPATSGVDRLLTASGRLPAEAWRAAVAAGRASHRVGAILVESGLVSGAELAAVTVLALYDAAQVLFDTPVEVRFEPGARHPLGVEQVIDLDAVCREVDRRKQLLAEAWPDPAVDTAAVVPARRISGQYVALSALQWEVVANADRRRSPVDLARVLGRDTFTTMLEVRRLVRAGLVEPGRPGGSVAAESVALVRARATAPVPPAPPELAGVEPPEVLAAEPGRAGGAAAAGGRPPDGAAAGAAVAGGTVAGGTVAGGTVAGGTVAGGTVEVGAAVEGGATGEPGPLPRRAAAAATGAGAGDGDGEGVLPGTFDAGHSEETLLRICAGLAAL